MGRVLLGLAVLLAGGAGLRADDMGKPYHLRVIVQVGAHRLLTKDFRDGLERELRTEFLNVLGRLDKVEVVATDLGAAPENLGPLAKLVAEKGLGGLDQATELTGLKTHFVQIDYVDGQYTVAARQHDGYTGLASPLVRTARTPDRLSVVRTALGLVGLDFGAVGEVVDQPGETARVRLKGAALGTPVGRLVRKGEVFALVRVTSGRGARVGDTLLVVEEEAKANDDVCTCRVLTSRKQLPAPPLRVIKLGTVTAPLRLRVNDDTGAAVINITASAGPTDAAAQPLRVEGNLYVSAGPVAHYAWVRLNNAAVIVARYPIELLNDGVVVRRPEQLTVGTNLSEVVSNWRELVAQAGEVRIVHASNLGQASALVAAGKNKEALEKAKAALDFLQTRTREIDDQWKVLHAETQRLNQSLPEDPYVEKLIKELTAATAPVQELIKELDDVITKGTERLGQAGQVRQLVLRAGLLRQQADFEGVIKLYQEILQIDPGQGKVKEDLERLQADWAKRDPQAANFAYKVWPNQTTAQDIRTRLAQAKQMFDRCRAKGDKLVPQKLLVVAGTTLVNNLKQQAEPLLNSPSQDDQKTLILIRDVLRGLREFEDQVKAYVGSGS